MGIPLVWVAKGKDPYRTAFEVLSRVPGGSFAGKRVLVKPNAARMALPGQGVTTDPGVVAAVVDFLTESKAGEILIGESCIFGVKAQAAFRMTGLEETARAKKIPLLDLDLLDPMEIRIPGGRVLKKIKVSSILKRVDAIVSVPVMKTHMHTRVTLGVKNLKGLLWRREKARFHHLAPDPEAEEGEKGLDRAVAEMARGLLPNLTVIDGMVGMEGMGPGYGRAKRAGLVVAGENAPATDAVSSFLMGFDPAKIPHLRLCRDFGLGPLAMKEICVIPGDFDRWRDPFEPPPQRISLSYPDVAVYDRGSCSACLSTLMVFLQKHREALAEYRLEDGKFHAGIGKHLRDVPEGTLLLGNCTRNLRGKGFFVQGCPPVSSQILEELRRRKKRRKFDG